MRFMILLKATAQSEAGEPPPAQQRAALARFHEALASAGVLLDVQNLRPSRDGWRIDHDDGAPRVQAGPFDETSALIAGYTLIDVPNAEAAREWSRRFPALSGTEAARIEVRRVGDPDDFPSA